MDASIFSMNENMEMFLCVFSNSPIGSLNKVRGIISSTLGIRYGSTSIIYLLNNDILLVCHKRDPFQTKAPLVQDSYWIMECYNQRSKVAFHFHLQYYYGMLLQIRPWIFTGLVEYHVHLNLIWNQDPKNQYAIIQMHIKRQHKIKYIIKYK